MGRATTSQDILMSSDLYCKTWNASVVFNNTGVREGCNVQCEQEAPRGAASARFDRYEWN